MSSVRPARRSRTILEAAAVMTVYGGLASGLLAPLFLHPASRVIDPLSMPYGWLVAPAINWTMWVLAWQWHALTSAPWRLFDANIFHPAPWTLATSQHLLGHVPVFGPVYALSGNVVLGYQLTLLFTIVGCGAGMYAWLRHWSAAWPAALFGGFVYAFWPLRMSTIAEFHLIAGQYLPLTLLFLDRVLISGRPRAALAFAIFLLLQMLCSTEWMYMGLTALVGYAFGILWATRGRPPLRGSVLALIAVAVTGLAVAAINLPYGWIVESGVIAKPTRSPWLRLAVTGLWSNYLYPPFALRALGWQLDVGPSVYVGLIALAFAGLALLPRRRPAPGEPRWACAGAAGVVGVCYLMALGPEIGFAGLTIKTMPYQLALDVIPGFAQAGVPARFTFALMAGFAGLAGLGLSRALDRHERLGGRVIGTAVVALLVTGTVIEYDLLARSYPVQQVQVGTLLPPVYRALAAAPGPVLEIPSGRCDAPGVVAETDYMLHSTVHWRPLLNGYGAHVPRSHPSVLALARALPDPRATALLARATGLRNVVVHLSNLEIEQRSRWRSPPGWRLAGFFGLDLLFEMEDPPQADLQTALVNFSPRTTTLLGTPLATLPETGRRASLVPVVPVPGTVTADIQFALEIKITNDSAARWPALAPGQPHTVHIAYRWEGDGEESLPHDDAAAVLPFDLAPGESVAVSFCVLAPRGAGPARLIVGLAQDGRWFPNTMAPVLITVEPLLTG